MVPSRPDLLDRLALLDQDYHAFSGRATLFERLEESGLLQHRTAPKIEPGSEPEPFVPVVATRAKARARFIHANPGNVGLLMDWAGVLDRSSNRCRRLDDPFATEFGPWVPTRTL
jgi:hypothetical protein